MYVVSVGWSQPITALIIYSRVSNPDAGTRLVAITKLGYSINTEYRPLVYRLLIGFLVLPYVFGVIAEYVLSRFRVTISWSHELRPYINGVILGLCFSYFVGYFHSALATEFGRQSLGGQVLLFLSGFWHVKRAKNVVGSTMSPISMPRSKQSVNGYVCGH